MQRLARALFKQKNAEKAYEMLPGRGDVAYNLLLGYARAGKRQEAIDLVATAEARGVSEERLAPARSPFGV